MYYLLYQNSQILLQKEGASYQLPESDTPLLPIQHSFSLTAPSGELCVAANVLTPQIPQQSPYEWIGIRQAYDLLPASIYQVVVKGAELTYWEATTKYCGSCGSLLEQHTDISKRCPKCQREFWPALALAVIVAITRNRFYALPYEKGRIKYRYVVTAVDRFHNESQKGTSKRVKL